MKLSVESRRRRTSFSSQPCPDRLWGPPLSNGYGKERLPQGATAAEHEVNHSPEAGESSQWAAVSILYIFVCVCTNSQIQVLRRAWLQKYALIIPASCVWRANVFAGEYSDAAVFRKISLFKSAPFQILSSWHKKEKKKKRAFKAAAFLWKYMFESWTRERGFCSLFKCKETILLASVLHWVQKITSDVHIR
jgi:hypothetical protein